MPLCLRSNGLWQICRLLCCLTGACMGGKGPVRGSHPTSSVQPGSLCLECSGDQLEEKDLLGYYEATL